MLYVGWGNRLSDGLVELGSGGGGLGQSTLIVTHADIVSVHDIFIAIDTHPRSLPISLLHPLPQQILQLHDLNAPHLDLLLIEPHLPLQGDYRRLVKKLQVPVLL